MNTHKTDQNEVKFTQKKFNNKIMRKFQKNQKKMKSMTKKSEKFLIKFTHNYVKMKSPKFHQPSSTQ